jgi:hypothetical protein
MPGRAGTAVDRIVDHWMAATFDGANARFQSDCTHDAPASAHYGVTQAGLVYQWVGNTNTAFHAGDWQTNLRSIGIEHEAGPGLDLSPAGYAASAQLHADLSRIFGIPMDRAHVLGHGEIVATQCPGTVDVNGLVARAQQLLNTAPTQPEEPEMIPVAIPAGKTRTISGIAPGNNGRFVNLAAQDRDCNGVTLYLVQDDGSGITFGSFNVLPVKVNQPNVKGPVSRFVDLLAQPSGGRAAGAGEPVQIMVVNPGPGDLLAVVHQ